MDDVAAIGDGDQGDSRALAARSRCSASQWTALGVVKAMGSDWITINGKSGGGASFEQTLKIDAKTMVLAKGASTAVAAQGGRAPLTDLVHSGDHVSASYHKVGDRLVPRPSYPLSHQPARAGRTGGEIVSPRRTGRKGFILPRPTVRSVRYPAPTRPLTNVACMPIAPAMNPASVSSVAIG